MVAVNREKEELITQKYLKEILNYDPETGYFIWLKLAVRNQIHIGDIAGCLDHDRYIVIKINGVKYHSHRLAVLYMTGNWPLYEVDHIKGINIPNFNKWSNLRDIEHIKNKWNQPNLNKTNTSGFRGVCLYRDTGKWQAQISVNYKRIHLGYFNTPEEASIAYEEAKLKYHIIKGN